MLSRERVWTVAKVMSFSMSNSPPQHIPEESPFLTAENVSRACLSMSSVWATNRTFLYPHESKAARTVLPVPVAATTSALSIPDSRVIPRLNSASTWTSFFSKTLPGAPCLTGRRGGTLLRRYSSMASSVAS